MTDVIELRDSKQLIRQQASEWLAKIESDELSEQERIALNAWTQQSAFHKQAIINMANNLERLKNTATNQLTPAKADPIEKTSISWQRWVRNTAAVVTLAVTIPLVCHLQATADFESTNGDYTTTIGHQKILSLADGSQVTLNTDSQLVVEFEHGQRVIRLLKGEANFDVASDPQHPFIVRAGKGDVQALGTSFAVRMTGKAVDVLVSHGKVRIRADDSKDLPSLTTLPSSEIVMPLNETTQRPSSVVVGAGKRVTFDEKIVESVIDETPDAVDRHLYWRKGYLAFQDQSLNQVVAEVSRYATFNIVIEDPSLGDIRVGGYYPIDNLETVFSSLEINFGLTIEKHNNNNTYYIKNNQIKKS